MLGTPAAKPAQFQPLQWRVQNNGISGGANIYLDEIPYDGGDPLTAGWYTVDGGAPQNIGGFTVGVYSITGLPLGVSADVAIYVSNSVDDGDPSVVKSVVSTPAGTLVNSIVVSRTAGFSPLPIQFTTDANNDESAHYRFHWDFGFTDTFPYLNPNREQGTAAGEAYGPLVATTYESNTTQQFTVTLTITDGTTTQVLYEYIDLTSGNDAFPTTNTICVDPAGLWAAAPAGAQQETTLEGAAAALRSNNGGRILLRNGYTYTPTGHVYVGGPDLNGQYAVNTWMIGTYDTGARAIFDADAAGIVMKKYDNHQSQVCFEGFDWIGHYNPTDGTGARDGTGIVLWGNDAEVCCHNMLFSGNLTQFTDLGTIVHGRTLYMSSCSVADWENFGNFTAGSQLHIYGCSILQNVDASVGDGKNPGSLGNLPDHGPIRTARSLWSYMGMNDMYTSTGWSSAYGQLAHQPCLRCNSSQPAGAKWNIQQNNMEGGSSSIIDVASQDNTSPFTPYDYFVMESNALFGTAATFNGMRLCSAGIYVRNNVVAMPAGPAEMTDPFYFLSANTSGTANINGNATGVREIHNNNFIDYGDNGSIRDVVEYNSSEWDAAGFVGYVIENNLTYWPNRSTGPDTQYEPLDTTSAYATLYKGSRYLGPLDPTYDTSGTAGTGLAKILATSPAIDAATTGLVALDTFDKQLRGARHSIGAFEP
tara:strand:- start:684 stop:2792 length:2109 start_codon:yes stop_codon:yes gene_type:complete